MRNILLVIILFIPIFLFSQRDTIERKDSISGYIALGGQILSGNYKTYGLTFASSWNGNQKSNDWMVAPTFRYTLNSGVLKELEFYSTQAYYKRLPNDWKFLAFSEIEHSWLRKTEVHGDIGVGFGYRFISNKHFYIESTEVILPDAYLSITHELGYVDLNAINRDYFALRSSTRLKTILNFSPVRFETINMIQPQICGWELSGHYDIISPKDNLVFRSTNSLDIVIKKGFSIGGSADIIYQTYPHWANSNIQSYDIITYLYIKYSFSSVE